MGTRIIVAVLSRPSEPKSCDGRVKASAQDDIFEEKPLLVRGSIQNESNAQMNAARDCLSCSSRGFGFRLLCRPSIFPLE
jgi:hypothetical protein